jgi:integrase
MSVLSVLDSAGRRRSPATMPGYHAGRPPRNKGMRYPADPPTVEEIVAVMRHAADDRHGWRLRAMIVVLWRAGLCVQEALALAEHDLDPRRGSVLVRNGKGGRRREVGMDEWGWEQLRSWLSARAELPVGPLFCIIDGPTRGRPWQGRRPLRVPSARRPRRGQAPASHRTSCPTRTRSSSPARAFPSTSSSASSGTPTSARPRSTCKGSTPRRSSPPSACAAPR